MSAALTESICQLLKLMSRSDMKDATLMKEQKGKEDCQFALEDDEKDIMALQIESL